MTRTQRIYKALDGIKREAQKSVSEFIAMYGDNDSADMIWDDAQREMREELEASWCYLHSADYEKLAAWFMI